MARKDRREEQYGRFEEYFGAGDDRFLGELLANTASKRLQMFAKRFYEDARPFARSALLAYVDDGCDRAHHRALVKQLFRHAESARDDEAMAHFLAAFDRLGKRVLVKKKRYDWSTRETHTIFKLKTDRQVPGNKHAADQLGRFTNLTRRYLQRRALRYFRRLGHRDAEHYGHVVRAALMLYTDANFERPEQLLDAWGLLNVLYHGSPVVERRPGGARVRPGRSLAELEPAPMHPGAWQAGAFREVFLLAERAKCRTVRVATLAILRKEHDERLRTLGLADVSRLLRSPHEELQNLGAELLATVRGLENVPLEEWFELLRVENPVVLTSIAGRLEKHVAPARLTLAQCVGLARAKVAPVAELGLRWAKGKPVKSEEDLATVMALSDAGAPTVRAEATDWLVGLLGEKPFARPEHVRDLLDARFADVRARALTFMAGSARYRDDTTLWAALAESPYDDARGALVAHLEARAALLSPGGLRHVWASTLLAVHRGGRAKRVVLNQVAARLVREPARASELVPLLAIALRSVRAPERRAALGAVARAAFALPALREAIAKGVPELSLGAGEVTA